MTIGDRVKKLRTEKGITQSELAEKLGYKSKTSVAHIENGRDIPRSMVVKLSELLDTSPAYLMGWEDEPPAPAEPVKPAQHDLTPRQERIVELFDELTEPQQDNIIGRAELLAEQNENESAEEGAG